MPNPAVPHSNATEPVISLDGVRFCYPGEASEALRGVTLSIHRGEHVCILGGNGSGKSTLLQHLNALLLPTEGRVRVLGLDSREGNCALAIRQHAAMVFQHPEDQMVTSIVADDVAFGPENLGVPQPQMARRVDDALAAVGMSSRAQADPADLSGGQKQRVAIAGALAMEPEILLLDEPSAMLDTAGRHAVQGIVGQLGARGITIVHVTHFMDDARRADRGIVMEDGRVALDGAPAEVFAQRDRVRALGLETPFAIRLAERLDACGLSLPLTADADELADALAMGTGGVSAEAAAGVSVDAAPRLRAEEAGETGAAACDPFGSRCPSGSRRPSGSRTLNRLTPIPPNPCVADKMTLKTGENRPSVEGLREQRPSAWGLSGEPAIAFEHVSFSYAHATSARKRRRKLLGRHAIPAQPGELAVQDLTFAVRAGSLTALVGRTGSGKSTTVELTCALKVPLTGAVRIAGIDTADLSHRRELRHLVGYVSQLPERQLFAETVGEDVAFGPRNLHLAEDEVAARTREALASVGLPTDDGFLSRSPFALSGGQQRGVALAGVLAMRPRVLVLDEPMAGLDPAGRAQTRALLARLKREGTTLLLVTHDMDGVAKLADHVVVLGGGRLAAEGTPTEVFHPDRVISPAASDSPASRGTSPAAAGPSNTGAGPLAAVGLPSALAFARSLEARGVSPLGDPLTLDALARALVGEATAHGAAR